MGCLGDGFCAFAGSERALTRRQFESLAASSSLKDRTQYVVDLRDAPVEVY